MQIAAANADSLDADDEFVLRERLRLGDIEDADVTNVLEHRSAHVDAILLSSCLPHITYVILK